MKILLFLLLLSFNFNTAYSKYYLTEDDSSKATRYLKAGSDFIEKTFYDSAIQSLDKAKKIFLENKLWDKYVECLNKISYSLRQRGEIDSSLALSKYTLEIVNKYIHNDQILSATFNQLSFAYKHKSDFNKALEIAYKSSSILGNDKNDLSKAEVYLLLEGIFLELSEFDSCLAYNKKAIDIIFRKSGKDDPKIGSAYNDMALAYEGMGDYDKALEYYFKVLPLKIKINGEMHKDISNLYNNIGADYFYKGENDLALEYYLKGLSIDSKLLNKDNPQLGYLFNNIAMAYRVNGNFDKAAEFSFRAEDNFLNAYGNKHPNYATVINNIGRIYSDKEEFNKALEYFNKSYEIFKNKFGESHPVTAQIQHNIGETYRKIKDYDLSLFYLNKALEIRTKFYGSKHQKTAGTLLEIGKNFLDQNLIDSALIYFQKAVISCSNFDKINYYKNPKLEDALYEKELLKSLSLKAMVFHQKFIIEKNVEDIKAALETCNLCDKLISQMRLDYKTEWSKLALERSYFKIYEEGISASLELYKLTRDENYKEVAFNFAERSKAGILSDAISESNAKKFSGIPDSLIEKEKQIKIDLAYFDTQIQKEKNKKNIDSIKLIKLQNSFFSANRNYEKMVKLLEDEYNDYYHLKYKPQNHTLEEIQNNLTDNKTVLLEYFNGDSTVFIFVVMNDGTFIEKIRLKKSLSDLVLKFRNSLLNINLENYLSSAQELYSILISPVKEKIKSADKLFIIPDGILNYLPFEALIETKNNNPNFSELDYLIKKYEISYYFSASTLIEFQNNLPIKEQSFAGFAPVFSNNEEVKSKISSVVKKTSFTSPKRAITLEGKTYSELPESETEVKEISRLFNNKNLSAKIFTHASAKEELIKSDEMKNYKYIHIASHGFINEKKPKLSGILFTLGDSTVAEDGILYSNEIYNLNLNADLLVLSACESGLGKIAKGEGVIGLTRGFSYSGAKNIIVSLWQVADKSTSDLMIEFYKNVLDGDSYSSALRKSKLKLINDAKYSYPLEWSPFILIGE